MQPPILSVHPSGTSIWAERAHPLFLEALWTERLDRRAQFRAAVGKVLRAPAGGKDDGGQVRRAQFVHHAVSDLTNEPRLPFLVPSQRIVEQDDDKALRGYVVGGDVRVHVPGPLGARGSGDGRHVHFGERDDGLRTVVLQQCEVGRRQTSNGPPAPIQSRGRRAERDRCRRER